MKQYIQYYSKSATSNEIVEACGDRSIIIIDGRENIFNSLDYAILQCKLRGFVAFRFFKGNLKRSSPVSQIFNISK